jgi:hypothetical protein
VQLAIVGEALILHDTPPPAIVAEFSLIVQFVIVGEALSEQLTPPP